MNWKKSTKGDFVELTNSEIWFLMALVSNAIDNSKALLGMESLDENIREIARKDIIERQTLLEKLKGGVK